MTSFKVYIHTALLCEAQFIIDKLRLTQDKSFTNFKLFKNDDIILTVSGIGKDNTIKCIEELSKQFIFEKAINYGIAGCCDGSVKIGTLFCTNKLLPNINFGSITTVDTPLEDDEGLESLLVDMEAKYFKDEISKICKNIFIFKVVSDYLDTTIPKKSFVIELTKNCFDKWKLYI